MHTTLAHLGVIRQSLSLTPCQWKSPRSCLAACCLLRWKRCWSSVAPTHSFLSNSWAGRCLPAAGDWTVDPRLDWGALCPPAAPAHQIGFWWRAGQDSAGCDGNGTVASWICTWVECLKSLNQYTHTHKTHKNLTFDQFGSKLALNIYYNGKMETKTKNNHSNMELDVLDSL